MKKLVILFVMIAGLASAQPQLRVSSFFATTDSINASTTNITLYTIMVQNVDSFALFNDVLTIVVGVEDTAGVAQVMDSVNVGTKLIPQLDSTMIDSAVFTVNTALFKEGNNTVVIWPISPGGDTKDSLYFPFIYNSVKELMNNNINVTIGPNPAVESFYLGDPDNLVKRVRIRSADGKLIRNAKTNALIWINDMNKGIYLVELETEKGIFTKKLIIH